MSVRLKVGEQTSVPPAGTKELALDTSGDAYLLASDGTREAVGGGGGDVATIVAGDGITVDATDPANPIVTATRECQDDLAATWAASMAAFIATKDASIVKVPWMSSMSSMNEVDRGAAVNTGTIDLVFIPGTNRLKLRLTSGTTASSYRLLRNRNYAVTGGVGAFNNLTPNCRTGHWAMAARVIINAVNATADMQCISMTDEATQNTYLGVIGGTSQTNFSLKIGSGSAIDTGVAIGTLGTTEHDLIMVCDGTTLSAYIDLAVGTVGSGPSNTGANAAGHAVAYAANGATASNVSMDILYTAAFGA